ncbi:hypothetical protein [Enterocloster citroniae]|uniref:hypothetical protein n=1 Tax=Enterocloster citroniae TaxID=358743 RepID=UPI0008DF8174|nr:hypothetical protein [Enterocloster citroniae]SFS22582.1 hypothetical protein SAMN05216568_10953 [Enterocloster citroniae]
MSAAKLRKILSLSFSLVIVLLFPLTIYASTATPSEARPSGAYSNFVESLDKDVLIASPNNATPMDEYMESDSFDSLNAPILMSSGDGLVYGTDYVYRARYRNSKNVLKYVNAVHSGVFISLFLLVLITGLIWYMPRCINLVYHLPVVHMDLQLLFCRVIWILVIMLRLVFVKFMRLLKM